MKTLIGSRSLFLRSLPLIFSLLLGTKALPLHAESKDLACEGALIGEAEVAALFPGLDRTFFRKFQWVQDTYPVVRVKYDGIPRNKRAAHLIQLSITRLDPSRFRNRGPEQYKLSIRLRLGNRDWQARLNDELEAYARTHKVEMILTMHWVTNRHINDGDLSVTFEEGPLAKHVSVGLELVRRLYDLAAAGEGVDAIIADLNRSEKIAPVLALPPPAGARIH